MRTWLPPRRRALGSSVWSLAMSSLISSSETDARDLLLDIVVVERWIMRRRRSGIFEAAERPVIDTTTKCSQANKLSAGGFGCARSDRALGSCLQNTRATLS
jgi:hypothetical protein